AQARLRAFENQELEVLAIVAHGHAPFLVVIALVLGIDALAPGAALHRFRVHTRVLPFAASPAARLAKVYECLQNPTLQRGPNAEKRRTRPLRPRRPPGCAQPLAFHPRFLRTPARPRADLRARRRRTERARGRRARLRRRGRQR